MLEIIAMTAGLTHCLVTACLTFGHRSLASCTAQTLNRGIPYFRLGRGLQNLA